MNCKSNGATQLDFLSLVAGGTADNADYICGLTQYTCGNKQMAVNDPTHPVKAELSASVVGSPQNLGNGTFCCEVLVAGTMTYKPCGCCEPREVFIAKQFCVPCSSAVAPTVSVGNVIAQPEASIVYNGCCACSYPSTNKAALTFSINVTTAA